MYPWSRYALCSCMHVFSKLLLGYLPALSRARAKNQLKQL